MYLRYASCMTALLMMLAAAWLCVRGAEINRYAAANAFAEEPIVCVEELLDYEQKLSPGQLARTESDQPVINVSVVEKKPVYELSAQDYETLVRIVEAEAGTEDETGKLLVANVVLNRVNSEDFPDTVTEVVYQRDGGYAQFSPVGNGSIGRVTVSEETIAAVERALMGEDVSQGALYFAARSAADPENMHWFDTHLTRLFAYGGHEFFD